MKFRVGVGKSDFADLRKSECYYVDKTEILYELLEETQNEVTLFTRPRRFGKTLMMKMMENFFNNRKDSKEIFEGLKIAEHQEFCEKWMNKYPVLFISFKDVDGLTFESAYGMLKVTLADVCMNLADLMDESLVDNDSKEIFAKLKSRSEDENDVKSSLKIIMRMLHDVYGKKVILLIDEYDVPLAKASEKDTAENPFYAPMLDVMRGIMSTSLKDNEFLEFAVITGCLRIAKESIFTGTNNFVSYSVLDEKFSRYFGFSEKEVVDMLSAADRKNKADIIKEWYDGYVFGNNFLYCPWDVINYMSVLKDKENAKPKNYWKNTSHNGILLTFVKRTDFHIKKKFETLLNGGSIEQTISDELTYDTLHSSEDNLWSVILMTGYLTKADAAEEGETVHLKIPNREIATIFEDTVVKLFKETIDNSLQKVMIEALWSGDEEKASEFISKLLLKTISYNDYHEDYYHAFLAGAFVGLGYGVQSNKEKGEGRPDILLWDENCGRAIIIEAKKSKTEADMEKDCDVAIEQIVEKKYAEEFDEYEYPQVLCYGISFFKKRARVKALQ